MTYTRSAGSRRFRFTPDTHDLSNFTEMSDTNVGNDEFSTVAYWDLDEGEGVAFGEGRSKNPDKAEAYIYLDPQNSTPAALNGKAKLVVLNAANQVVDEIYTNKISKLRNGDPATDSRGDWGVPFPYQAIKAGKGEVLGKGGYKIGIQLKLDSGTDAFSLSDSTMEAEGFSGSVEN